MASIVQQYSCSTVHESIRCHRCVILSRDAMPYSALSLSFELLCRTSSQVTKWQTFQQLWDMTYHASLRTQKSTPALVAAWEQVLQQPLPVGCSFNREAHTTEGDEVRVLSPRGFVHAQLVCHSMSISWKDRFDPQDKYWGESQMTLSIGTFDRFGFLRNGLEFFLRFNEWYIDTTTGWDNDENGCELNEKSPNARLQIQEGVEEVSIIVRSEKYMTVACDNTVWADEKSSRTPDTLPISWHKIIDVPVGSAVAWLVQK